MQFTRILLSIVFVLIASTALAAKPEKTLVCHVGSELGSNGETYQENPECLILPPYAGDPADYICPDAGKVDLISVSAKAAAKHIADDEEQPKHFFEDESGYLWEDYAPEAGIGDDPADFEEGDVLGIDRGCELAAAVACPCWPAGVSDATAAVDVVDSARGPLTCVEASNYNAADDIVHIVSFYSPGCDSSTCGALAFAAFTTPELPNICNQNDAYDGAPPPSVYVEGISDQEFDACLAVLEELAEQESCN